MEVLWGLKGIKKKENSVLTVGTFDGLHLGHQYILDEVTRRATVNNLLSTLVTFHPHPKFIVGCKDNFKINLLTPIHEKINILQQKKLDRLVIINFTREFSQKTSREFVEEVLFGAVGFKELIIGYDHAFGKNREGNFKTLSEIAQRLGFLVTELSAFSNEKFVISSTRIRNMLYEGEVSQAAKALGRLYSITGKVVEGHGKGKLLEFPTANLEVEDEHKLIPADGVYAVYININSQRFKGMMNIGNRPTFPSAEHTLEVNIFDFDEDIYGESVTVEFVQRLRAEKQFENKQDLVNQLKSDKETTVKILNN